MVYGYEIYESSKRLDVVYMMATNDQMDCVKSKDSALLFQADRILVSICTVNVSIVIDCVDL